MTPLLLVLLCIPVDIVGVTSEWHPGYASRASADTWAERGHLGVAWNAETQGTATFSRAQASSGGHSLVTPALDVDGSTPVECGVESRHANQWSENCLGESRREVALDAIEVTRCFPVEPATPFASAEGPVPGGSGRTKTRRHHTPIAHAAGVAPGHSAGVEASTSIPLLVYGGSALADYLSTRYALEAGAVERNPLMRGNRLVVMKAVQVLALTYLDVELQRRGHRGKARVLRVTAAVVGGALAVHNWRVANAQRRGK